MRTLQNHTLSLSLALLVIAGLLAFQSGTRTGAGYPVYQTADQTSTSTTLADSNDLKVWINANEKYAFQCWIPFNLGGVASGYKFQLDLPSGVTFLIQEANVINPTTLNLVAVRIDATVTVINGALTTAGDHSLTIQGTVQNGSTAGFAKLQFAQNTADAVNAITLKKGGNMILTRINN